MYDHSTVDRLGLTYGPRELLAQYLECVSGNMRELGLRLRISADLGRLMELSREHRENCPPVTPILDPAYNDLDSDTAFLIECIDEVGDTVMTSAGRLLDHGDRSLAADLRSLRVFYGDPAPRLAAGDTATVTAPSAAYIFGRTGYSGAVWVRPDYRRHGLTKVIPRLTRSLLFARWNTPVFWATITPNLDAIGVTRAYGSWHVEESISLHLPQWRSDCTLLFLSMGQATLIRDIAGSVEDYEIKTGTSRWIDSAIASKSVLSERQGMINRS